MNTTFIGARFGSLLLGISAMMALAVGCSETARDSQPERAPRTGPLSIHVVNYPLAYFAERVGGDHVEVVLLAPGDVDPAFWRPDSDTIAAYQTADLIIGNGAGYAAWTRHASLPRSKRVDTSAAFADRLIELDDTVTHGHGPAGDHSHAGTAFTTWLDPTLATEQARAIAEAIVARRPEAVGDVQQALAALEVDLAALDRQLELAFAPLTGEPLLFSHPVYQYLARRYRLDGRSLHLEPGEMPDPAAWRALERMLADQPVRVLLFEGEPHAEAEARLRELGIRTVVVEPAGNRPSQGDWLTTMRANADRVAAVPAPTSPPSALRASP